MRVRKVLSCLLNASVGNMVKPSIDRPNVSGVWHSTAVTVLGHSLEVAFTGISVVLWMDLRGPVLHVLPPCQLSCWEQSPYDLGLIVV